MKQTRKAVISVAEMARMCGLSRQRFYQLMGTVFPLPVYDVATRRPFYTEALQQVCLQVKESSCGVNGRPVLFYATSRRVGDKKARCRTGLPKGSNREDCADLLDGVRALGLAAKEGQVVAAVVKLFPSGIDGRDKGEIIKQVFLHLKQQESVGNTGT